MNEMAATTDALPCPARPADISWLPGLAGLIVAGLAAWVTCPIPPAHPLYLDDVVLLAVWHVALAAFACAVAVWLGFALVPADRARVTAMMWKASAIAVWLSPLVLLLMQRLLWAALVVSWITGQTALLFRSHWSNTTRATDDPGVPSLFQAADRRFPLQRLFLPFLAAAGFQSGMIALMAKEKLSAILLSGGSVGLAFWLLRRTEAAREDKRTGKPAVRRVLLLAGAILLSALSMVRFLALSGQLADHSVAGILILDFFSRGPNPQNRSPKVDDPPAGNPLGSGGGYRGVILWPDADPHPILLAPPPVKLPVSAFIAHSTRAMEFQFSGVYWFFKPPDMVPPPRSPRIRGNPAKMGLRSSDEYPLVMEAHQGFTSHVNLACCSQIQVVIDNAEVGSHAIALELAVADSDHPGKAEHVVGTKAVPLHAPAESGKESANTQEVMTFDIPAAMVANNFNELIIRFRRGYRWNVASSRIAIKRFVFIPR
jgi:hypothetical protein